MDMAHLDAVSDEVCRKILKVLCETDTDIKKKAFSCLWAYKNNGRFVAARAQGNTSGIKRKAVETVPEVKVCKNCGDGFLEENNDDEACAYHPGRPGYRLLLLADLVDMYR